jgi:hypothetical protein
MTYARLNYQPDRFAVVVADRPDMLHRADCFHLTVPNPGAAQSTVRPARVREARTLPVCQTCAKRELGEGGA